MQPHAKCCLSGYVHAADDEVYAFTFLVNEIDGALSRARKAHDRLVLTVAAQQTHANAPAVAEARNELIDRRVLKPDQWVAPVGFEPLLGEITNILEADVPAPAEVIGPAQPLVQIERLERAAG